MTATARQLVDLLLSQEGDAYVFGAEASISDTNPDAFDCSELVEWGCGRLAVSPTMPDGSWRQFRHLAVEGTVTSVKTAAETAGGLLFRFSADPLNGPRPTLSHVAVSQGNGRTIEARGKAFGVGQFLVPGRGWTHAGLVPGLDYKEATMFPDVPADHPHHDAIEWAAAEGLVQGYPDGTFRPEDPLTRGQICTILQRFHAEFIA